MNYQLLRTFRELDREFDNLKELFSLYQQNINNNLTWFYAILAIVLTIVLAISAGALGIWARFLVQKSVIDEFDKLEKKIMGIVKDNTNILHANGNITTYMGDITLSGLLNFSPEKYVSLVIYNLEGEVLPHKIKKMTPFALDIQLIDSPASYEQVYWNLNWRKN